MWRICFFLIMGECNLEQLIVFCGYARSLRIALSASFLEATVRKRLRTCWSMLVILLEQIMLHSHNERIANKISS